MLVEIFVDGASRGNGVNGQVGEAACAVVIYKNKKELVRYARGLGRRSNNAAEYEAILCALQICVMSDFKDPVIYSDSAVAVKQINSEWVCKSRDLLPYLLSVQEIKEEYRFYLRQVPRRYVWQPNDLCQQFLDRLESELEVINILYGPKDTGSAKRQLTGDS